MANTFPTPPGFTDPAEFLPGQDISSEVLQGLMAQVNYLNAHVGTGQGFNHIFMGETGTSNVEEPGATAFCSWRVAVPSDQHTVLRIYVCGYYTAAAVSGSVRFASLGADHEVTIDLPLEGDPSADDFSLTLDLDIGFAGNTREDMISMYPQVVDSSGSVVITQVYSEVLPLTSPLDPVGHLLAAAGGQAYPMDSDIEGPLPARVGRFLADTLSVLAVRSRSVPGWLFTLPSAEYGPGVNGWRPGQRYTFNGATVHLDLLLRNYPIFGLLDPQTSYPASPIGRLY